MMSLTMSQIDPEGRPKGERINVKVGPSARIGDGKTGVFVPNGSGSSFAAGFPSYRKPDSSGSSYFRPACPEIAGKR